MSGNQYDKVYCSAMRMLGVRMYSCKELSRKLENKEYSEKDIAAVIAELLKLRYLNDVEYARSYIRLSYVKLKGKKRIERELREKGVSTEDIEIAFDEFDSEQNQGDESELDRAMKLAEKGLNMTNINIDFDDKESIFKEKKRIREKLTRKLLANGFAMDITYKAVEKVLKINTNSWKK